MCLKTAIRSGDGAKSATIFNFIPRQRYPWLNGLMLDIMQIIKEAMTSDFNRSKSTINEHILNIFKEKELEEQKVMIKFGNFDFSTKPTNYYNLDMVIAIGYRVKSKQRTQFWIWQHQFIKNTQKKGGNI